MGGYCSDGEPYAVFIEGKGKVQAKEGVACDECKETIPKGGDCTMVGARFREGAHVEEGTSVCCAACKAVFDYFWERDAECLTYGSLVDWVQELSPHDFAEGGDCADMPKGCKPIDEWVAGKLKEFAEEAP